MSRIFPSHRRSRSILLGAVFLTSATVGQIPMLPATAQRSPTISACDNEKVLMPTHPDVRALNELYEKYIGSSLPNRDLGLSQEALASYLMRFFVVKAGQRVVNESFKLSAKDTTTALTLNRKYDSYIPVAQRYDNEVTQSSPSYPRGSLSNQNRNIRQDKSVKSKPVGALPPAPPVYPAPLPASVPPLNQPARIQTFGGVAPLNETRAIPPSDRRPLPPGFNTEDYNRITDNPFFTPKQTPLSTFSIDVDTASYSNVRRFLRQGQLPPKDAVRIEEMVNYFSYNYDNPQGNQPFSVKTELSNAPWNPQHKLVKIGLKGRELTTVNPSNLVFLVDVSGSMKSPRKLNLVKRSLCLLVKQMKTQDRVSLVVYAGSAGVVLPPTTGNQKRKILQAIDRLEAGGSTAGAAGIKLAYQMAEQHFLKGGNNRVILATDGDFNVGVSSNAELERLIEQKRDAGVFLTVLGFGTGNYKDSRMELLADKGNGNYAYIDNLLEAQKVLVHDLRSTLFTIAKDVKIQVEFNPEKVQAYRLIGYENRLLKDQDFNDDRKDAGDIGSGHTVTALYEVIPTGVQTQIELPKIDDLKYQTPPKTSSGSFSNELMQVKLRYKQPNGSKSSLISMPVQDQDIAINTVSPDLKFATAVTMFGMVLRDSEYKGTSTYQKILSLAQNDKRSDRYGYRQEFVELVQRAQVLSQKTQQSQR